MPGLDAEYTRWIGRTETTSDPLAPTQAIAAAATFDLPATLATPGEALPLLWHWFHFLSPPPQSTLAADGHARRGGFLPPIAYPHRMFAGGRLTFHAPLRIGTPARRTAEILDVALKSGRSGSLAFVRVGYRYEQGDTLCLEEEQDIVYRETTGHGARAGAGAADAGAADAGAAGAAPPPNSDAPPPPPPGARLRSIVPDAALLFRFSALTFNAHRIHYDRDYARLEGGYPGLVVHGPLLAMLLMSMATHAWGTAHDAPRQVHRFSFRSERPLFDVDPFALVAVDAGDEVRLEARGAHGVVAQRATATLR
jgi:3-methylfumaryl-CoA hydratase